MAQHDTWMAAADAWKAEAMETREARIVLQRLPTITGYDADLHVASLSITDYATIGQMPEVQQLGVWKRLVQQTMDGPREFAVCLAVDVVVGATDKDREAAEAMIARLHRAART